MRYYIILTILAFLSSCGSKEHKTETVKSIDVAAFSQEFLDSLWVIYPGWASYEGLDKYDAILTVPDAEQRERENTFATAFLARIENANTDSLSSNDLIDLKMIKGQLGSILFSNNELKSWQWDPSNYNIGGSLFTTINRQQLPLKQRMESIYLKLGQVPAYYQAARANITIPTKEHTELAIQRSKGILNMLNGTLKDSLSAAGLDTAGNHKMLARLGSTVVTVENYMTWLQDTILAADTFRSYNLGKDLYTSKFDHNINAGLSAEQAYKNAVARKAEVLDEMEKLAKQLFLKYYKAETMPKDRFDLIAMLIDTVSAFHTQRDSILHTIEQQIPELEKFIKDKDLIYLDPSKPLVVRETPEYMRGVAGASISSPGPFEPARETYYNVTPLTDFSDEGAESYLREYNDYMLQILNIHEAIPGHYTQLIYSNKSPSIIKSILGNGTMVEGWAVYGERMMLEAGYGENSPELWLVYYKWHLRSVVNTILDYSVHVLDMGEEDAIAMLTKEAFQETAEASGKWRRVKLTQVQLCSYFTGYDAIYRLREEWKAKKGTEFDLKEFHEQFLSYGSAPVPYIRELMMNSL